MSEVNSVSKLRQRRLGPALDQLHVLASRSRLVTRLVLKLRNQCDAIVRARFRWGIDSSRNGEERLIAHLGASVGSFLDVGAHQGQWARKMAESMASGRGVCFEPSERMVPSLRESLVEFPWVEIVDAALGERPGRGTLWVDELHPDMSSLVAPPAAEAHPSELVRITTLDLEVRNRSWTDVDFLKVDAEGWDLPVLRGGEGLLSAGAIKFVQFEYSAAWRNAGSTLAAAASFLSARSYGLFLISSSGLLRYTYEPWGEFFGYANFLAVAEGNEWRIEGLIVGTA